MSICWYCHWGWAKPVADIYEKAVDLLDGDSSPLEFGPAHVVWSDENFEMAEECLGMFDERAADSHISNEDLEVVRQSLIDLCRIPIDVRCPCPDDYDLENPSNYPPSVETVRI